MARALVCVLPTSQKTYALFTAQLPQAKYSIAIYIVWQKHIARATLCPFCIHQKHYVPHPKIYSAVAALVVPFSVAWQPPAHQNLMPQRDDDVANIVISVAARIFVVRVCLCVCVCGVFESM